MDIKYIKDNEGNNFFPVVHEKGVVDDNGTTLESKLLSKQDTISDIEAIRSGANLGTSSIQSVAVGTTTTGAAGSSASVTNTGTATEPVLSFTIPQGAQGIQGIQGPQGERGPQGNTGVQVDSVASIIHSIDPTATYAAADVAGADAVQATNQELTELAGGVSEIGQKPIIFKRGYVTTTGIEGEGITLPYLFSSPIYGSHTLSCPTGYKFNRVNYYNLSDGTFSESVYINSATTTIGKNGCYSVIGVTKDGTTTIYPEDVKLSVILEEHDIKISKLEQSVDGLNLNKSMVFKQGSNVRVATFDLKAGITYTITITLASSLSSAIYPNLRKSDGTSLLVRTLAAGATTLTYDYTPTTDIDGAYLTYSYTSSTQGNTITLQVTNVGIYGKTLQNVSDIEALKNKIVYLRHVLYVITDGAQYSDWQNGDYGATYNALFRVTNASTFPASGSYSYVHSLEDTSAIFISDGNYYKWDGEKVIPCYNTISEISQSSNLFDKNNVTQGIIRKNGTISADSNYAYTDYIPVTPGQTIITWWDKGTEINYFSFPKMRFVTAYNVNKVVQEASGAEEVREYVVPNNIYWLRITLYATTLSQNGVRINVGNPQPYEDYFYRDAPKWGMDIKNKVIDILRTPYKMLPTDVVSNLAYKRLGGPLKHGYIILSTDDGRAGMASYTIPLAIEKNVPISFCIMSESVVMQDNTMQATVLDAVNNHNCEIIQHGANRWADSQGRTHYQDWELREFLAREKAFWDNLGVVVKGAAVPEHETNDIVKAIVGGTFGMCRCGYNFGTKYYDYYCNGPKSNIYALASQNFMDNDLAYHQAAIDYAIANHYIYILYWHEVDLTDAQKTKLEAIIDYAKTTDIVFAKLGDVPDLD